MVSRKPSRAIGMHISEPMVLEPLLSGFTREHRKPIDAFMHHSSVEPTAKSHRCSRHWLKPGLRTRPILYAPRITANSWGDTVDFIKNGTMPLRKPFGCQWLFQRRGQVLFDVALSPMNFLAMKILVPTLLSLAEINGDVLLRERVPF